MRAREDDKLLTCPTCATPVASAEKLGLRDYRWVNGVLPGREGAMDIDGVIEKNGYILAFEFKPKGARLSLGARLTLRSFVARGIHVWIVWDHGDVNGTHVVEAGAMAKDGTIPFVESMPLDELKRRILAWRKSAQEGKL